MLLRMEEHFKALVSNKVARKALTYPVLSEGQHEQSKAQQVGRIPTTAAVADLERAAEMVAAREAEASPESIFLKASPVMAPVPPFRHPPLQLSFLLWHQQGTPIPRSPVGKEL